MVVLGHSAFTLEDLLLVVLVLPVVGGDDLALGGLDTRAPWDKDGLYTESIWVDVEEDNLTWVLIIGNNGSPIWVDGLAIEEVPDHQLDPWNSGETETRNASFVFHYFTLFLKCVVGNNQRIPVLIVCLQHVTDAQIKDKQTRMTGGHIIAVPWGELYSPRLSSNQRLIQRLKLF